MPDWSQAPEWAQYCAQDRDGSWAWFKDKPEIQSTHSWCNPTEETWCWVIDEDEKVNWKDSLQSRP